MNTRLPFSHFFSLRNREEQSLIDRTITNNVSVFVAFLSYKLGVTPNQITLTSCAFSISTFAAAMLLPVDNVALSVIVMFSLAQFSFILDCADGQLASSTHRRTRFGWFLDHGLDMLGFPLEFGGFFGYLYRHYRAMGDQQLANASLLIGFFFLLAYTCRFFAFHRFRYIVKGMKTSIKKRDGVVILVLRNVMEHQASLFGILLFLVSPTLTFAFFSAQTLILMSVYLRYFLRVRRLDRA